MTQRHVTSGRPSTHAGPLEEYADESWADWVRRQNDPRGTQKKTRTSGQGTAGQAPITQEGTN